MNPKKQKQSGGDGSQNFQAAGNINFNTGLTVADVKEIAADVFRSNFLTLSGDALAIAQQRARDFDDRVVASLEEADGLGAAADPDFQYSLYTGQVQYARTGDDALSATLVDLLTRRAGTRDRSLLQVTLNEAIGTVGKLTPEQYDVLSVIWVARYVHSGSVIDTKTLGEWLDTTIGPIRGSIPPTVSSIRHLEYAGCVSVSIGSVNIADLFAKTYAGVFSKGFSTQDAEEFAAVYPGELPGDMFVPHELDDSLLRLAVGSEMAIRNAQQAGMITEEQADAIVAFMLSHQMTSTETGPLIRRASEVGGELLDAYENSDLKNVALTSVGIAIAHSNLRRVTDLAPDLAIWVN
jgi:hypothetical protein